ncbi:hypothetical protein A2755_00415 [Candidatus Wolfebacteria bacterium RIFCSPHIGHO2_01_FULL_48_22]|uniref:Uncharacterized protein n=1 Tax=Candidatus Wolfebacteria bacterium RIFCSPHIGHO2_01_FULL_48_22 TaxID=1802555 RepID=A0A1F8DXN4_9BACT|nr:MAG: hypothetical protein A2755_00415 [Candidatus Wolfebacteria bacterium RIFCSPHIGHO2_01_FULL_48_22]
MRITVTVKLHKQENEIIKNDDGSYTVHTHSTPVDGKANKDVINQVAKYFKVPKSSVKILSGTTSKKKVLEIE